MFNPVTTARNLRKRLTDTERSLWSKIRARQIEGCKFRRQTPIGKYIVDFVCHEQRVIVEVDGGQHYFGKTQINDLKRDDYLKKLGF